MQRNRTRNPVIAVVLAVLVVVLTASCAEEVRVGLPAEEDPRFTWIAPYSYEKVFLAALESCARLRELVIASDKVKGTITCKGAGQDYDYTFAFRIRTINSKRETEIKFVPTAFTRPYYGFGINWPFQAHRHISETQAVLAGVKEAPSAPGTTQPPPAGGGAPSQQPSWSPPRPLPSPSCTGHGIGC